MVRVSIELGYRLGISLRWCYVFAMRASGVPKGAVPGHTYERRRTEDGCPLVLAEAEYR